MKPNTEQTLITVHELNKDSDDICDVSDEDIKVQNNDQDFQLDYQNSSLDPILYLRNVPSEVFYLVL